MMVQAFIAYKHCLKNSPDNKIANLEWDTLLFFYGVMVGVGGLSFIGYLGVASQHLYGSIDPAVAIGSAAGVGLMGQTRGIYTFVSHLKWTPAIILGYFGSIAVHFLINGRYF